MDRRQSRPVADSRRRLRSSRAKSPKRADRQRGQHGMVGGKARCNKASECGGSNRVSFLQASCSEQSSARAACKASNLRQESMARKVSLLGVCAPPGAGFGWVGPFAATLAGAAGESSCTGRPERCAGRLSCSQRACTRQWNTVGCLHVCQRVFLDPVGNDAAMVLRIVAGKMSKRTLRKQVRERGHSRHVGSDGVDCRRRGQRSACPHG